MSLHFIFRIRIKVGLARGRRWACFGWNVWSCELLSVSSLLFQQQTPCLNQQQASGRVWLGEEQSNAWGHTSSRAAALGTHRSWGLSATLPFSTCLPFLAGKMSTFSSATELEISPLLHVKGNPSYNRVRVMEGIKSKNSPTHQHGGSRWCCKRSSQQYDREQDLLRVKAGCQNPARDSLRERRDGPE